MNMTLSKRILAFTSAAFLTSAAQAETQLFAGGWSGNGGDLHAAASNTWFAGDEPIEACVTTREFTTLSQSQAEALVHEAVADWQAFFKEYGLSSKTFNKAMPMASVDFMDGQPRGLSTDFIWKSCDQLSNEDRAVRFMFGAADEAVIFFREMATENAYGLALRKAYDHQTYRSGGIVWVSGELKSREDVKHILLHELGHVFGMQHDSVFVMDEDVVRHLSDLREVVADFLGKIEAPAWRYALKENSAVVMTSHGRRIFPDAISSSCHDQQYRPNRLLPLYMMKRFRLNPTGCHRIALTLRGARPLGGRAVQLTLKEFESGREWQWDGEFYPEMDMGHRSLGPGIFTQWQVRDLRFGMGLQQVWRRMDLDDQSPSFPAQGYLVLDGVRHAMQISVIKGLRVQIFLPEVGRYWVLRTVHDAEAEMEAGF